MTACKKAARGRTCKMPSVKKRRQRARGKNAQKPSRIKTGSATTRAVMAGWRWTSATTRTAGREPKGCTTLAGGSGPTNSANDSATRKSQRSVPLVRTTSGRQSSASKPIGHRHGGQEAKGFAMANVTTSPQLPVPNSQMD